MIFSLRLGAGRADHKTDYRQDVLGRLWTARRVLHNRRAPVRFLPYLPRKLEFMRIAALWLQHNICALSTI